MHVMFLTINRYSRWQPIISSRLHCMITIFTLHTTQAYYVVGIEARSLDNHFLDYCWSIDSRKQPELGRLVIFRKKCTMHLFHYAPLHQNAPYIFLELSLYQCGRQSVRLVVHMSASVQLSTGRCCRRSVRLAVCCMSVRSQVWSSGWLGNSVVAGLVVQLSVFRCGCSSVRLAVASWHDLSG